MPTPPTLALGALLVAGALVASPDDFQRERGRGDDAVKDSLEGKRPPAFVARDWLNTDGPLSMDRMVGQVVLIDFWGTW